MLKSFTIKAKLYLSVGFSILALLIVGFNALSSYSSVKKEWKDFINVVKTKQDYLITIRSNMGYGGGIHVFKNYVLRGRDKYLGTYQKKADEINSKIKAYREIGDLSENEVASLQKIEELVAVYGKAIKTAKQLYDEGKTAGEIDGVIKISDKPYLNALSTISKELNISTSERTAALEDRLNSAKTFMIAIIPLIMILLVLAGYLISKDITSSLSETIKMLHELGDGNLVNRLNMGKEDEVGQMADQMDHFAEKFERIIADISGNARKLADSSAQLSELASTVDADAGTMSSIASAVAKDTEKMSSNTTTVANAAEEATANINQVSASVKQMSQSMTGIESSTEEVTSNAHSVAASIEEMSSTVSEISKNTLESANISELASKKGAEAQQLMENLGSSAKSVGNVIEVINDIADRTNLLALNATIEAASAGEAGKGFAVVANEVKELAKQTSDATEEIVKQIEEMRESTDSAVKSISDITATINEINSITSTIAGAVEEQDATTNEVAKTTTNTVKALEEVKQSVAETATGAEEVARNAEELSSKISEISANAAETSKGTTEVSSNIQEVNKHADSNLDGSKKMSQNAVDLSGVSEMLQQLVNQFILSDAVKKRVADRAKSGVGASIEPLIKWSDRFSTGVTEMDNQHKVLIDFVNKLDSAMKTGKGKQVVGDILDGLIAYTGNHFKAEEELLTTHGYGDYPQQKAEHEKLVGQALEIQKDFHGGKPVNTIELMDFLKDWLTNHIQKMDKQYGPFLNSKGVN